MVDYLWAVSCGMGALGPRGWAVTRKMFVSSANHTTILIHEIIFDLHKIPERGFNTLVSRP